LQKINIGNYGTINQRRILFQMAGVVPN
jgi:hypothetical protein